MARYNKIYLGPVEKNHPQVQELLTSAALVPGRMVVVNAGKWAYAGASTTGKVWLLQDNYLLGKKTTDAWASGDRAIALELQDGHQYAAVIPTGTNVTAIGTPFKLGSDGKLAIATAGDYIVAFADEVFNNDTGEDQLIRIRVAGTPGPQGQQGEPGTPA